MSLLDIVLMDVIVYYKDNGKKIVVLTDKEAEEILKDSKKSEEVKKFTTKWARLNWKEQNEVMMQAYSEMDPRTGDKIYNYFIYRDSLIKRALKEWDQTIDGKVIPVTPDLIDRLPSDIVLESFNQYERSLRYTEEEEKN